MQRYHLESLARTYNRVAAARANTGSILRLVRRLGDADLHRQRFAATPIMRTTQRGCAEIIESRRDPHMRIGAANAVRRVESNPAKLRHARLCPGITSLLLGNAVIAKNNRRYIARECEDCAPPL
jgi:hypothetical protein